MTITVNGIEMDTGCYGDGTFGDAHVNCATIILADNLCGTNYKMEAAEANKAADTAGDLGDLPVAIDETAEKALADLNDHTVGGVWMFCDGDLILMAEAVDA